MCCCNGFFYSHASVILSFVSLRIIRSSAAVLLHFQWYKCHSISPQSNTVLSSLFPLPIVPRALSFSFSPASPQYKEASAEERDWGSCNSGRVTTRLPLSMLYTNLLCDLNTMFDKTLFFLLLAVLSSSVFATFSRNFPNKDHDKAKEGKCRAETELQITNCDMQAVS